MNHLKKLEQKLLKIPGKYVHYEVWCKERNAQTEKEKIKIAEEVLACWGGGVMYAWIWELRKSGAETFKFEDHQNE